MTQKEVIEWPVVSKESVVIGNRESPVSVCSLWTLREQLANQLDNNSYSVIGNLYSGGGISGILRNILANPRQRYIIMHGNDLSKSGEELANFFGKGIDENRKIVDSPGKIEKEIDRDAIEAVRSNVTLFDFRKASVDDVRKKLGELAGQRPEPFSEPRLFPESQGSSDFLESEASGFVIRGKNVADTWLKLIDAVMKFGKQKPSEYNIAQKELVDAVTVIEEKDNGVAEWLPFTEADLENYLPQMLSPSKPEKVAYTYGERLFRRDQDKPSEIEKAVGRLRKNLYSRRAFATTWRISEDSESANPPCLTQVTWLVQENKLFQTVFFRSHDLYEGWPMNLMALQQLQHDIANELGVQPGHIVCVSHSAHLYENRWNDVKEKLEKYHKVSYAEDFDKRGIFKVELDRVGKKIVVTHFTLNGSKTGFRFIGDSVEKLIKEISHTNLISQIDHAFYLGKELQKARIALEKGVQYNQDRPLSL